ncbi:MAG: SBBP repeat-containing protein, partial [Nitrospira sp.]|nr:SBBP repeat-containing protein [Nitrospira sp.]
IDAGGSAYLTGQIFSTNFPTAQPFQPALNSVVFKSANGGSNWSAINKGLPNTDIFALTIDPQTPSTLYAGTNSSFDAFVVKLNPLGSDLVYSTYLGGSSFDSGNGIAVDASGNAYVTGDTFSTDFPTVQPLQPSFGGGDAFITKLNAIGSTLIYSTYLGGQGGDRGSGIAVDTFGNVYVAGSTSSVDFPVVNPLQPNFADGICVSLGHLFPCFDAFVAKLNSLGSAFIYSTYLGGNSDERGFGIAVDASGNAFVTGSTQSTDFPTVNPLQPTYSGGTCTDPRGFFPCPDGFVAKLNPLGSALAYSTYLGGTGDDRGFDIALNTSGNVLVVGSTQSTNFPTANPLQPTFGGSLSILGAGGDAFITKIIASPLPIPLVDATDYNGDGRADIAVYRSSTGQWFVSGAPGVPFGSTEDIPTPGDYDGNGTADFAFWRPATGDWHVLLIGVEDVQTWGIAGDIPVPGDYDGDKKTDRAVWRPATAEWWILLSGGGISY